MLARCSGFDAKALNNQDYIEQWLTGGGVGALTTGR